jgi:hypothetical protein
MPRRAKKLRSIRERDRVRGHELLDSYVAIARVTEDEAAEEYTISDAITALLHHADERGFEADSVLDRAKMHFLAETWKCPDCDYVGDADDHECKGRKR